MPGLHQDNTRAGSIFSHARRREVLARLLEITRRNFTASRPSTGLPVYDGAGFEDRLRDSIATPGRGSRRTHAPARSPLRSDGWGYGDRYEYGDTHTRVSGHAPDGGVLIWIELDGLETIEPVLLERAADELREIVRERIETSAGADEGMLGRYDNQSFVWMRPAATTLEQAVALADALLKSLSAPWRILGTERALQPSLGLAYFPHDGTNPATLLMHASAAMRRARHYRMGYAFFSPVLDAAFALPVGIPRALAHNATRSPWRSTIAGTATA